MKNLLKFLFFFTLLFIFWEMHAQNPFVKGTVKDENGVLLKNAEIRIDGSESFKTNQKGVFQMMLPSATPQKIIIRKRGKTYKIVGKPDFQPAKNILNIIVEALPPTPLEGTVTDAKGKAVGNVLVIIDGVKSKAVKTNEDGEFVMKLPSGTGSEAIRGFIVAGSTLKSSNYNISKKGTILVVNITLPKSLISESRQSENTAQASPETSEEIVEKATQEDANTKVVRETMQVFHVVMYNEGSEPVDNAKVIVDIQSYKTDQQGRFEAHLSEEQVSKITTLNFQVDSFEIVNKYYDPRIKHMYLYVKDPEHPVLLNDEDEVIPDIEGDTSVTNYAVYFHRVVNQLEMRKQLLIEKSTHIRDDIQDITAQLEKERLTTSQRNKLNKHLDDLRQELIQTDVAFEEVEEKTHAVIDEMEAVIEQNQEGFRQELLRDIAIFAVITLVLLIITLISVRTAQKIKKQKIEIERQKTEIEEQKKKIERAFKDIQEISAIGQEITAALDFKTLVRTVNQHITSLIGESLFGVGVLNEAEQKLDFIEFIENNETLYRSVSVVDEHRLSAWCVNNRKRVIINDLEEEWVSYLPTNSNYKVTEAMPRSLMYLPLIVEDKVIGVVTARSSKRNAYTEMDAQILQALDSYIAIALYNANIYEEVKTKNKNITDSIRYAQTIQEASLPTSIQMQEALKDYFIIYRPKDIVSGDFYWLSHLRDASQKTPDKVFVAVVDCTGHGVPGAFMSMIGNNLLNEIINQKKIHSTPDILELLNAGVKQTLKQDQKVNDDGMDVCLCLLEKNPDDDSTKISFSGAKRPLYYVRQHNMRLQRLRGDLKSVGGFQHRHVSFTNQELVLNLGDKIYLTSDGLVSQNGLHRVKFGTDRFERILQENVLKMMSEQGELLIQALDKHQHGIEQRDDITVIGIEV